jgi:TPR repeat protein
MRFSLVLALMFASVAASATPPPKEKPSAGCSDAKACFEQGKAALAGHDDLKALSSFDQACTAGTLDACCFLGVMYGEGKGVTKSLEKAAAIYSKACAAGGALACVYEGRALSNGDGVPKDPAKAAAQWRQGCDGGNMLGCYFLGAMYEAGTGVPLDFERAAAFYQKAIDGGEGQGLYGLGTMLLQGRGFPKTEANDVRAFDLLSRACKQGEMQSCTNVGFMFLIGRGTKKDPVKAADFSDLACSKAHLPMACLNLGICLEEGVGRPRDRKRGRELVRQACDAGLAKACDELKR